MNPFSQASFLQSISSIHIHMQCFDPCCLLALYVLFMVVPYLDRCMHIYLLQCLEHLEQISLPQLSTYLWHLINAIISSPISYIYHCDPCDCSHFRYTYPLGICILIVNILSFAQASSKVTFQLHGYLTVFLHLNHF